jgi:hypothetical protein
MNARFFSIVIAAALAAPAIASPTTRVVVNPSSIFIYSSNSEDKGFNCALNFTWAHDSFGEKKVNRSSNSIFVPAKYSDGEILRIVGSYVNVRIEGPVDFQCNRIN